MARAQGAACVQGSTSFPIAHKTVQTMHIAQLSSFAASLVSHNCSLLRLEIFVDNPC